MIADIPIPHQHKASLAAHTTFRIGGPADVLLLPRSPEEFIRGMTWARAAGMPLTVLGGGSNVLIADAGVEGAVMLTTGMQGLTIDGITVDCEAGVDMNQFCHRCAAAGLDGVQNFHGMPGSVGGAVYMNARCYDRSIADVVEEVSIVNTAGDCQTLPVNECAYAYKSSRFQKRTEWILTARFRLRPGDAHTLLAEGENYRRQREDNGQYQFPNAGCIFKNDYGVGIPSGRLIEECGLKGMQNGGATIFEKHANFIINTGQATAADVLALIELVEETVLARRDIRLQREIRLIGRWDSVG